MTKHNVVAKWHTDFPDKMAQHLFKVEGDKYVWVFESDEQPKEMIELSQFYEGIVFTTDQLLESEKALSSYQMVCEFIAAIDDEAILPYWKAPVVKCECGSEKTFGPSGAHATYCPKYQK